MRGVYGLFIAAFLLTGCVATDLKTGSGALTLSGAASRIYQQIYQELNNPGYFIVSDDGSVSEFTYCDLGPGQCDIDLIVERAATSCEKRSGTECYLLARGTDQIWDGPVEVRVPEYVPPPPPPEPKIEPNPVGSDEIIPKSGPNQSVATAASDPAPYDNLSDLAICIIALSDNGNWTTKPGATRLIAAAQQREMSPITCQNKIINDVVEFVEAIPVPQHHVDFYVCRMAALEQEQVALALRGKTDIPFGTVVGDLNISDCATIIDEIENAPDAGYAYISTLPSEAICELAIKTEGAIDRIDLDPYFSVAAQRGLTPETCK